MAGHHINPVLESFRFALSLYGLHVNLTGVLTELPREDVAKITLDDIEALADKINVHAKIQKQSLKSINNNEFPVIVLLKDDKACVVMPDKTHAGKIYVPGSGVHEKDISEFSDDFDGRVIVLNPTSKKRAEAGHSVFSDWIWGPVARHKDQFLQVILASFFINLFALAIPLYTMNVYDSVVPNFALDTLAVLTTGVFLALAFDFLFKTLRNSILEKLSSNLGKRFDFELMERLMQIPALKLNMSVGRRSNLFREVQMLRDFYANRLGPSMVDFPFFLLFIIVIGSISTKIVLVPIAASIFILSLAAITHGSIKRRTRKLFESMQDKSSAMIEMLEGTETLKLFNGTGNALFKWNVQSEKAGQATEKSNFMMAWTQHASTTAMYMVNVFVIIVGVYEIQSGALTVGGLIASTILSSRALAPIMALSSTLSQMKKSAEVLKTIKHLFTLPTENEYTRTTGELGEIKGKIKFRNVSFSYPDQPIPALNGVNFEINPGEKVAVIGKNGAGKSTIANLVTGLLKATDGNVLIDGQAIESINLAELRQHIGIVPQKSFFFSGTLRDNVMMGREEIDPKRFQEIIDLSGLSIFLEQTSRGLDTEIGENGERLSGGQQQSIAIARALLHDPEIMIFDEPTSAMDQGLETQIKETFTTYLKEKTLILVTHRTTLLGLVERVLYLDQGQIVADGPRDVIMGKLSGKGA